MISAALLETLIYKSSQKICSVSIRNFIDDIKMIHEQVQNSRYNTGGWFVISDQSRCKQTAIGSRVLCVCLSSTNVYGIMPLSLKFDGYSIPYNRKRREIDIDDASGSIKLLNSERRICV